MFAPKKSTSQKNHLHPTIPPPPKKKKKWHQGTVAGLNLGPSWTPPYGHRAHAAIARHRFLGP